MVNYSNGKIYKIEPICVHDECDIYIGSTTKEYLSQRMDNHRRNYRHWKDKKSASKVMVYDIFDKYDIVNCNIILIELVNANSKDELLAREKHYIKSINCINKVIPLRSKNEYYQDNKELLTAYKKDFYELNKDTILKNKKEHYESNREAVLESNKVYRVQNREKICTRSKEYYSENKDKVLQYQKEYKLKNKEEINKKESIEINCECGKTYHGHKSRHIKSQKHINYLKSIEEQI